MTKAKSAPAAAAHNEADQAQATPATPETTLGQDVAAFEATLPVKELLKEVAAFNHVDLINANTTGILVLFPYVPRTMAPGVEYPVMKGHLDTRNVKVPVSAFMKSTDEGRPYLSLSIGVTGQAHIGGAVFRQEVQSDLDGRWRFVPGKENERFGLIAKTEKVADHAYDTIFQLNFSGKRRLSGAGVPYIKGNVYPMRHDGAELEPAAAMAGCF